MDKRKLLTAGMFVLAGIFSPVRLLAQTLTITSAPYNASTGSADNAAAIQAAVNAVGNGGTVLVPAGTYLSGPVTLKSNMTFQLSAGATLQMTAMGTFPSADNFLSGSNLTNITINGSGVMDGQGAPWWAAFNADNTTVRPNAMIYLTNCTGVSLTGITVQNSPMFHIQLLGNGSNIYAAGLSITAAWPSPNTDGIDLRGKNVLIENCYISDGDDLIQLGGTQAVAGVTIQNCTFGTGHGLSIGGYTQGGVQNLLVNNCTFTGTQYGIRWKSGRDRGGVNQNLTYSNITMTGILAYPFYLTSWYPANLPPASDTAAPVSATTPYWENIILRNITASTASGAKGPGIFWPVPEAPVTNLLFDGVTVTGPTGITFDIHHGRGVTFNCNCRINGAQPPTNVGSFDATITYPACGAATSTPTKTATSVLTPTPTPTKTATSTATRTFTSTATKTATATPTSTETSTPSNTASRTATSVPPTGTSTPTNTATSTPTKTNSFSPTATDSMTPSATASRTLTATPSSTTSSTPTASSTATGTASLTATPSPTNTGTASASPTRTSTTTATLTATASSTQAATGTASSTATSTATSSFSPTGTPTSTPSSTASSTPISSFTPTGTASPSPTLTTTSTASSSPTPSGTPTLSPTGTLPPTGTPTDSKTPSATATLTLTATPSNTTSWTPTASSTATGTASPTATPTSTKTPTFSPTVTFTLTASRTPTPAFTLSETPTTTATGTSAPANSPTSTSSTTPSATASQTPTASSTATGTVSLTASRTFTPTGSNGVVLFPNPAQGPGPVTLQITLSTDGRVQISVFTTAFRRVNEITLPNVPAGITDIALPLTDRRGKPLANGLYYVVIQTAQGRFIVKLMVIR